MHGGYKKTYQKVGKGYDTLKLLHQSHESVLISECGISNFVLISNAILLNHYMSANLYKLDTYLHSI